MWNSADSRSTEERRLRVGPDRRCAAGLRGIAGAGLSAPEVLSGAEKQNRLRSRRLDQPTGVRADAGPAAESSEVQRLEMREALVRALDRHDRVPILELVALVECRYR